MYFSAVVISVLAAAASAVVVPQVQADPHKGDFRGFGAKGCKANNLGVYTVLQSYANQCKSMVLPSVGSIYLTDLTSDCARKSAPPLPSPCPSTHSSHRPC